MRSCTVFSVLMSCLGYGLAGRILFMVPFPGKSHHIFISAIVETLIQRGHEVVEYSAFPPSKPKANYTHFKVHTKLEDTADKWNYELFMEISEADQPAVGSGFNGLQDLAYDVCEDTFKNENIKALLKSNQRFDLVVTEASMGMESLLVFGHKFKAPTVTLQGFYTWYALNRAAGNSLSLATIPDCSSLVTTDQMSFSERFLNFVSGVIILFRYYNIVLPRHENLIRQEYNQDFPPLVDMVTNVSLYLINTHPAVEYVRPYSPNIIPIAGITSSSDRVVLPQNIKKYLDEAKNGFIYFSLGTVVPAHVLPKEILQIFVNVFKKLPYKVLWKINLDKLPGISQNIMIIKWVPQPGVLAHPNCKLFMTHGGLFGQQEALTAGVPTVGIPFFGDQPYNVRLSEHRGFGVKVDYKTLSEESLQQALYTVLNNPKYKENAVRMSLIYRDRPLLPADSTAFWVEYVMRHGGAVHLRPMAAHLAWYKLYLLDVLAAVGAGIITVLITLYIFIRTLVSLLCKKKLKVSGSKKIN